MSIKHLFDQFVGTGGAAGGLQGVMNNVSGAASRASSGIPGGLAGGLAAGGIVSLLVGSKKARKYAGKAATFGGAALLGGAAFKLYQNWQQNSNASPQAAPAGPLSNTLQSKASESYQVTLIKAMIAAAKADGHIDSNEQSKIFEAVETLALPADEKALIFDFLSKPISVMEIAQGLENIEQKTEVYLASCLVCDTENPAAKQYLEQLAAVLNLPADLKQAIEAQAQQAANS